MQKRLRGGALMLLLLVLAPWSTSVSSPFDEEGRVPQRALGDVETVVIGGVQGGVDDRLSVDIVDGRSIARIDLTMEPAALGRSTAVSWTGPASWNASGTLYDGMDVNSSILRILPNGAFWDFESPGHGWTLDGGGNVWKVGYDSTLGPTGGVASGSNALYTYDGSYPNSMGQFWATSPDMDCSGCSGSWTLSYMRRLGVESSSWDHAYVQVKNPQGTWSNIWSNGATMNEGSFSLVSHDISTYIAGNPSFAVRFGLGTSDSSVTYTGWNLDDILIEPTGGVTGTGMGNWTSAPFGPPVEGAPHARLHLDADVPEGSVMEVTLLDALTSMPVPGFTALSTTTVDLGAIDAELHPLLRLHLALEEGPNGGPLVGSVGLGGRLLYDMETLPFRGWLSEAGGEASEVTTFSGTTQQATVTGTLTGPVQSARAGIGALVSQHDVNGASVEISLDGGPWITLDGEGGLIPLSNIAHRSQVRIVPDTAGASWSIGSLTVDMLPSPAPLRPMVDVGSDGAGEWGLVDPSHGRLGLQDRFLDGSRWKEQTMSMGADATFSTYLPSSGVDAFGLIVDAPAGGFDRLTVSLRVGGQQETSEVNITHSLTDGEALLPAVDLALLNQALDGGRDAGPKGLDLVQVDIVLSGGATSAGALIVGGLFAPYDGIIDATLTAGHPLVVALNGALGEVQPVDGVRTLHLPVSLAAAGALRVSVDDLRTTASVEVLDVDFSPDVMTLVPGDAWYVMNASFDAAVLGSTNFLADMVTQGWSARMVLHAPGASATVECRLDAFPLIGDVMQDCTQSGIALEWTSVDSDGGALAGGSGSEVWVAMTFRLPVLWGDEPSAVLSLSLVAPTGPMLPASRTFGLGSFDGIAHDVGVTSWWVSTSSGFEALPGEGWLAPGDEASVEVDVGFSNVALAASPRPGDLMLRVRVNGVDIGSSSLVTDGHARFPFTVPSFVPEIDIRIDLEPLKGQERRDETDASATFSLDTVAPLLLGTSTAQSTHLPSARDHEHHILVGDRPMLPSRGHVMLWRSWLDDLDGDGTMDAPEYYAQPLEVPDDLSFLQGQYAFTLDASSARDADWYAFYYRVADAAGHRLLGVGNATHPMSIVQVSADAAPTSGDPSVAGWSVGSPAWLHPDERAVLTVPLGDANGVSDIASVVVDLDLNTQNDLTVRWTPTGGCEESHAYLSVHTCTLMPMEDGPDPFHQHGVLELDLSIDWGFDPDTSALRVPSVTVADRSGQFTSSRMEDLAWRASSEIELDSDEVEIWADGLRLSPGQAQVRPSSALRVEAGFVWVHSARPVVHPLVFEALLDDSRANATIEEGGLILTLEAPSTAGTHGLLLHVLNAPDGLVHRGSEAFVRRLVVDVSPPVATALTAPRLGTVLLEDDWSPVTVDVRVNEDVGLGDVWLGWRVMVSGFGLAGETIANGSEPMLLRGARNAGEGLPLRATLDLDAAIPEALRTQRLELRVWLVGSDLAGQAFIDDGNAPTDPLGVWLLEQRVPMFTFNGAPFEAVDSGHIGGSIRYGYSVLNVGKGPGEAQVIVEVVASDGTRTRIDARSMPIGPGAVDGHEGSWVPTFSGPVRIEYILVDGTTSVGATHLIDEAEGSGLLGLGGGGLGGGMVVLLALSLIAAAAFRFARTAPRP
jgi:hypothetical protein